MQRIEEASELNGPARPSILQAMVQEEASRLEGKLTATISMAVGEVRGRMTSVETQLERLHGVNLERAMGHEDPSEAPQQLNSVEAIAEFGLDDRVLLQDLKGSVARSGREAARLQEAVHNLEGKYAASMAETEGKFEFAQVAVDEKFRLYNSMDRWRRAGISESLQQCKEDFDSRLTEALAEVAQEKQSLTAQFARHEFGLQRTLQQAHDACVGRVGAVADRVSTTAESVEKQELAFQAQGVMLDQHDGRIEEQRQALETLQSTVSQIPSPRPGGDCNVDELREEIASLVVTSEGHEGEIQDLLASTEGLQGEISLLQDVTRSARDSVVQMQHDLKMVANVVAENRGEVQRLVQLEAAANMT